MMENNEVVNAQPELLGITVDRTKSYMYEQLWKLCAGPLCDLPKSGENVYYFPQGHIEFIEESIREEFDQLKPFYDLPSKLRCRVIGIELKAENDTDNVFAKISLMPDTPEAVNPISNNDNQRPRVYSFTKILTTSDISPNGGLSIPKRHATECLPPLDMSQPLPNQELVAKDLHGHEWRFLHTYRGTPHRHLFTSGWSAFVTSKKLIAGDTFVFLRGENGDLRIGIRRARPQLGDINSSVVSTQIMHHGILASAVNAFNNRCMFIVVYYPRSTQFVVSYDKFLDAMNNNFNVGSKFMMRFKDENFSERRYSGTIIGIHDLSPHWKDSEWRNLQVQWDELAPFPRPDKVSLWEIENLMPSSNLFPNKKRSHQLEIDQEIGQPSMRSPRSSISQLSYQDSKFPSHGLMSYSISTMPKPNYDNEQMVLTRKEKITTDATTGCMLFGVELTKPSETKDPMGPVESYQKTEISQLSQGKKCDHTQTLTSPNEVKHPEFNSTRSHIKAHMQGVAIGRAVNLSVLHGYKQLILELDKLFDLKGELRNNNQWKIVYKNSEGDTMFVGDDPWPKFCNVVKRIIICSKEEVTQMKS